MNMNIRSWAIGLALLGEMLIALTFYYFIPSDMLTADVRILDFIVVSVVFCLWTVYLGVAPIDLNDRTQKQVGSLGVRLWFVGCYSLLAILFMLYNLMGIWVENMAVVPFKGQLFVQSSLLFLLLIGILSTVLTRSKTEAVFYKEQSLKEPKKQISRLLAELADEATVKKDVSPEILTRIKELGKEFRFISPSSSPQANDTDRMIISLCREVMVNLQGWEINPKHLEENVARLSMYLAQRKRIN